jgi:NNP family nitrate/nitrite transporter-like MFS transporter
VLFSAPPLLLSFAVWMVWSMVVVELPKIGFEFTTVELFWLAALPGLSGGAMRLAYSFVVPIFGGRNFTVFSTLSLLLPALWMAWAVPDPSTGYTVFVAIALLCGLGGGNFSSSMANISFFFPQRRKGTALGLNAGVGNLGVGIMQAVVPLTIYGGALAVFGGDPQVHREAGVESEIWLQNAGYVWVPFILAATAGVWFGMNNIRGLSATLREQLVIFERRHAWILAWLYTGIFGFFIGFSAAFPALLSSQFPGVDAFKYEFIGPLLGALVRPIGGWLADVSGGARVTVWNFAVMLVAAVGVLMSLPSAAGGGQLPLFFAAFMVLFITAGVGNGSVFRMVPTVFSTLHEREAAGKGEAALEQATREGEIETSVALGFTAAVAALGLFFIPAVVGVSIGITGLPTAAWVVFVAFYASCVLLTWRYYARRGAEISC